MVEVQCPSRETLTSFVRCSLPEQELDFIGEHLETCEACDSLVSKIEVESNKPSLADPVNSPTIVYQNEPEYQNLIQKAVATRIHDSSPTSIRSRIPEIPDYQIVRLIDRGGMGSVYEAIQLETGRRVAVKVLNEETNRSKPAMQLFLREAEILSRLKHSSIVQFEEIGTYGTSVFIAMEYVETADMNSLFQSRTMDRRIRAACGLICQILSALELAHGQGLVHRDVKPSNILVTKIEGKFLAKLSDFGLAKNFETAGYSGITAEGEARGTLGYMAPEQFVDSRSVKPTADVYSLGVTLFQYLAGRLPFEPIKNPAEAARVLQKPPLALSQVSSEIPDELSRIVSQSMSYDPRERIQTARAFRELLMKFTRRPSP